MPNRSGVWDLRQVGVNEVNELWKTSYFNGRALFAGGRTGSSEFINVIQYIEIATTGNATDFGDLAGAAHNKVGLASKTRGVAAGGSDSASGGDTVNIIEFGAIATNGNFTDFGDLSDQSPNPAAFANNTRGVIARGNGTSNVVDFITIASAGNASDFGNLEVAKDGRTGLSSNTRGIFACDDAGSNNIEYFTIASAGNGTEFGILTTTKRDAGSFASPTRGVFAGGQTSGGTEIDIIDYITISSTGNATDFGDLSATRYGVAGVASQTRGVIGGGLHSFDDTMEYVTGPNEVQNKDASTGNMTDFGNLLAASARRMGSQISASHGGLV